MAPIKKPFGFTLVEVIVSISIFTMVIAGGLAGVIRGFDILQDSRHFTRISQIAQSEMETLRTIPWQAIIDLPSDVTISVDTQFDTNAYNIYTVRRKIITVEPDLRRVLVAVSFENKRGKLVTRNYVTYFTKGGVNDYYYRTI